MRYVPTHCVHTAWRPFCQQDVSRHRRRALSQARVTIRSMAIVSVRKRSVDQYGTRLQRPLHYFFVVFVITIYTQNINNRTYYLAW